MVTENQDERLWRITFYLEQDEDNYPPATSETLWGQQLDDNLFLIDNIPFFVVGISYGDIVCALFLT